MANKVTYGLENVSIAFVDTTGYKSPQPIAGAVNFTPTPQGTAVDFYADNSRYYYYNTNDGYTADLEVALIPDDILAEMLGWKVDELGGIVEVRDATPKRFALMGEVKGDAANRKFVYYDVQAARPSNDHSTTTATNDPQTTTLPITIFPKKIGDEVIVKYVLEKSDTNATEYAAFFTSVPNPDYGTEPPTGG